MINILKGYIFNISIIANKILLKTIKINIKDYLIYIPKVIKLFFKLLLILIINYINNRDKIELEAWLNLILLALNI